MDNLNKLENKSVYIIREAFKQFKNPAILWSIGKDSTTLLWLCRKALPKGVQLTVVHIDTEYKFKEIYDFREKYAKKWNLNLMVAKNEDAIKKDITPIKGKFECCNARKTEALKQAVKKYKFDALLLGIRRDEHGLRNKERIMSPRDKDFMWRFVREKDMIEEGDSPFESMQDVELEGWNIFATDFGEETDHVRVHPIIFWTEQDIWNYIQQENIPTVDLYFAKNGKRYRSIGCETCCNPVDSDADTIKKVVEELKITKVTERSGRAQDKEQAYMMQKLRSLGYM